MNTPEDSLKAALIGLDKSVDKTQEALNGLRKRLSEEGYISKVFSDEAALRRWYKAHKEGTEEDWKLGPNCILNGFELQQSDSGYPAGTDVADIAELDTDFDCGVFNSHTATWNDSLEALLAGLHKDGKVQIDVYYQMPIGKPEEEELEQISPPTSQAEYLELIETLTQQDHWGLLTSQPSEAMVARLVEWGERLFRSSWLASKDGPYTTTVLYDNEGKEVALFVTGATDDMAMPEWDNWDEYEEILRQLRAL